MKEFSDYLFLIFKSTEAVDEPWDLAVEPKSESKLATFHWIEWWTNGPQMVKAAHPVISWFSMMLEQRQIV
jgi:hypothetical protein